MGSNREKFNIAIAILEKLPFLKGDKIISHFHGSNNIVADCICFILMVLNILLLSTHANIILSKPNLFLFHTVKIDLFYRFELSFVIKIVLVICLE